MDATEGCHRVANTTRRSLRDVVDLQCEWTGEALIQALRDGVRSVKQISLHTIFSALSVWRIV